VNVDKVNVEPLRNGNYQMTLQITINLFDLSMNHLSK